MLGNNVEGNRTNMDSGYIQPMSGIMNNSSTPYSIFTPVNAPPTVTDTMVSRNRSRDLVTLDGSSILSQIRKQHQLEIEQLINHQMENVKLKIGEISNRYDRGIEFALEEIVTNKMRVREEKMRVREEEIVKINNVLEDKVKSLSIENQLWRELVHTNEETTNDLRNNLEQALAKVSNHYDDAASSCGSNNDDEIVMGVASKRLCRICVTEEASILVLPCRHLCLCTVCGSSAYICPICKCSNTASVQINFEEDIF